MTASDPARGVLAAYVDGVTLELGAARSTALPGTTLVRIAEDGTFPLEDQQNGSVDAVISRGGLEHALDPLDTIERCRDLLRERGRLALVIRDGHDPSSWTDVPHAFTPAALQRVLVRLGGFEVTRAAELTGEDAWLVVAERRTMLDVRSVLGMHGAALADAASRGPEHHAELLFQIGTILLRTGDTEIARRCYEQLQTLEPGNAECAFGLGMCHALERRWSAAVTWLRSAVELDPSNGEARRWLGLAQLELDSSGHGVAPQSAVQEPARATRP